MFVHTDDQAMGNLGYERREADYYPTPSWVTKAVVPFLFSQGAESSTPVWEPTCGTGEMSEVLSVFFNHVESTDLHDYGYRPSLPGVDFLATNVHHKGLVITNPPYGDLAEAFIRHALKVTQRHKGMVAMLLRKEYDAAKGRVDLFNKPPFAAEVVLTTRPRWIEGSTGAPRHNYSWWIWNWRHAGPAHKYYHVLSGK